MNFKMTVRTLIVLCAISLTFCRVLWAEDPHFLSAYHCEYGLKLYHDGKMDFAIERFVKALLLDPENKTAKDSLRKISAEIVPSSNSRVLEITRFIDQIEYFNFLDLRYRSLTTENSRLFEFVRKNFPKDPILAQKVQTIESRQADRSVVLPSVGELGFASDDNKKTNLPDVILNLSRQRQLLLEQISFWEEQNNDLRLVRRSILSQGSAENPLVVANKLKSQLSEVENRTAQKDDLLATQHQNIEYFQSELSSVRDNFYQLQQQFKTTDLKIGELNKKLAEMSIEIFEKNKIIAQKEDYAAKLQREISEANEKMNLVQRIIQEKDDRIASLEKEMSALHLAVNSGLSSSDPQVVQLKSDFKNFEEQFKSQMGKSRERIISLEIQFADLTQKYQLMAEEIQAKDLQIGYLKEDANKKDVSISQYRNAFLTTNEKANELIGMLDIYRNKLAETKQALITKEQELTQFKNASTKPTPINEDAGNSNPLKILSNSHDLTLSKQTDR